MMRWQNQVVAVTGAAGFLGSHLAEALVEAGATVLALDNFSVGTAANLEAFRGRLWLLDADISQQNACAALAEADLVFHLAAMANPRACEKDWAKTYRVNVEGTRHVLAACRRGARVIFLSGAMVYGEPTTLPIPETHTLAARDSYALSKMMGECLTWAVAHERQLRATVVRNFSSYGPRQSADYVIARMIQQGLEQGAIELWSTSPTRDFTYISDTIRALLAIAERPVLAGEVVNLGSARETLIGEVAQVVARLLGGLSVRDLGREVLGSHRQCADNRKLRQATGWQPRVLLEEGLAETLAWMRAEWEATAVAAPAPTRTESQTLQQGGMK
ncbi:MAG: SDR family NAD(P)-dependent oxidoreductase [Acidobacteria bacterium]|nr:SDR family NAD(P)-dependent oxidoreductase [Acidobacteriota bacterium]